MEGKVANPAPLGLMGFGMTTVLLNIHNAMPDMFPMSTVIIAMGICYGGIAQIIAGIFEYGKGNTFGMTAFVSYGFFWLSLVVILLLSEMGAVKATPENFLARYLFLWGIFTLFMYFATLKKPKALQFVFFTLFILFFLLAAKDWGIKSLAPIAGWEGILCGFSAIYLAMAEVVNEAAGRVVLPIGEKLSES